MGQVESISTLQAKPDDLYKSASEQYGPSLDRLATAYEADPEKRRDLVQEIHFQLWRSLRLYDTRCSLRTWTYRVAHHVAASYVMRERRTFSALVSLADLGMLPDEDRGLDAAEQRINLTRLSSLIQQLKPLDRQVIVSWLEGLEAGSIGEITGLSRGNVAVRIFYQTVSRYAIRMAFAVRIRLRVELCRVIFSKSRRSVRLTAGRRGVQHGFGVLLGRVERELKDLGDIERENGG